MTLLNSLRLGAWTQFKSKFFSSEDQLLYLPASAYPAHTWSPVLAEAISCYLRVFPNVFKVSEEAWISACSVEEDFVFIDLYFILSPSSLASPSQVSLWGNVYSRRMLSFWDFWPAGVGDEQCWMQCGGWRGKAALPNGLGAHGDGNHPPILLGWCLAPWGSSPQQSLLSALAVGAGSFPCGLLVCDRKKKDKGNPVLNIVCVICFLCCGIYVNRLFCTAFFWQ